MKRYLIFGAIGPLVGGFLMLFATTVDSGYWTETNWSEIGKFLGAFVKTLQYSYLFGIVPMLMLGAIDDILYHVKRISPVVRMLIAGRHRLCHRLVALWLARAGCRCAAVCALRHRRPGACDAVVLAGAQICRRAAGGAFDLSNAECRIVGWAKAHLRRAHHPSPRMRLDGGHACALPTLRTAS